MRVLFAIACLGMLPSAVCADALDEFLQESCIGCHDADTDTRLDFTRLEQNFTDEDAFRTWVRVFDRVNTGEMPPEDAEQPDETTRDAALKSLEADLTEASRAKQRTIGRVPTRRLTRQEYENTLHDLLGIGGDLAKHLPGENRATGSFDVVAASQDMSSVHVRSLLRVADLALDEAIQLGPAPNTRPRELDYLNSPYIDMWVNRPVRRGGGTIFKTDQDVITFRGENYVLRSDHNRFRFPIAGHYRISVEAAAWQPRSSVTLSLKRQNDTQGESELFAAWDLDSKPRTVTAVKYLRPDDFIYVSGDELDPAPNGALIYGSQPASEFGGEGVRIRRVMIEGPLIDGWPPKPTRNLFAGIEWRYERRRNGRRAHYTPILTTSPAEHAREVLARFAVRVLRRDLDDKELDELMALIESELRDGRGLVRSVRPALKAILVHPELVFHAGKPGPLDGDSLARRLACFLWRSCPDDGLLEAAGQDRICEPTVLAAQVDRMLVDPRFDRFIEDFLGQWLGLDRIDATTPDRYLYPEYDDVLRRAMLAETHEFFAHLVEENLSVTNLVDSDFTFLNRRLGEHYGIDEVRGENMRKVILDESSVRGGILTHASVAKVTANGTVTTPVKRGNFVLTTVLGLPPSPPPPGVGAIEPDTRGATTIRETLTKHQAVEACAVCHRRIDPPGYALECFDPVGHFRQRYRNSKNVKRTDPPGLRFAHKDYTLGHLVDASGVTEDGFEFAGIREYKEYLRGSSEQIARNFLFRLIAFATGAEVQFADRETVERILRECREQGYPVRTLIHRVVDSRIFRNR